MMVDLPEPEDPTRAVTLPGTDVKLTSSRTGFPGSYSKSTFSKLSSPFISGSIMVRSGSAYSSCSWNISRVRSSPATASVIWLPIFVICMTGAARKPINSVYWKNWPCVIWPDIISFPPMNMMTAPTLPITRVEARLMVDMAVSVFKTFCSSFSTPPLNTCCSRSSAW